MNIIFHTYPIVFKLFREKVVIKFSTYPICSGLYWNFGFFDPADLPSLPLKGGKECGREVVEDEIQDESRTSFHRIEMNRQHSKS